MAAAPAAPHGIMLNCRGHLHVRHDTARREPAQCSGPVALTPTSYSLCALLLGVWDFIQDQLGDAALQPTNTHRHLGSHGEASQA